MTNADNSIVEAFETLGMTPEQISETEELELSAVKASLMQFSKKYKDALMGINGKDTKEELDFREAELKEANTVILDLMRYSDDDRIRAKLAIYVRDDKKGRLDAKELLINNAANGSLNINVLVFNERLQKAREAKKRAIDVESTTTQLNGDNHTTSKERELQVA